MIVFHCSDGGLSFPILSHCSICAVLSMCMFYFLRARAIACISYGNSVHLSWSHDPVPFGDQVR